MYWAPFIEQQLFDFSFTVSEMVDAGSVLLVALLARPLGGFLFGRMGDKIGRKKAFTLSVIFISIPTFLVGFTDSYDQWNLFSVFFLIFLKFMQGVSVGGEIAGAICYLAENSPIKKKYYMCSFTFVGPQIGLLLSLINCLLIEALLPKSAVISWGWRISFFTCGLFGIIGYCLRRNLHESHGYNYIKNEHKVLKHPIRALIKSHKKQVSLGFLISIFETVAFCILTIVSELYFKKVFHFSDSQNFIFSALTLTACAVLPICFGKIADMYKSIPLLEISAIGFILLSYSYYTSIKNTDLTATLIIHSILVILFSIQVAFLPSLLAGLFPVPVRYSGVGLSFNISDGIFWGLTPVVSAFLIRVTTQVESFVILLPITSIVFLCSYFFTKKEIQKHQYLFQSN